MVKTVESKPVATKDVEKTAAEKAAENRRISKMAADVKKQVFELEEGNDQYIYVFRSKGGWWKMGQYSALFYANIVCEKLSKRPPKILKDSDHFSTFRYGVISKKDLQPLADELKKIGMRRRKITPAIYAFKFEKPIEKGIITTLVQAKEIQRERANKLVDTQLIFPKMHLAIRDVMKMIWYYLEKHRDNMAKKVILPGLLERAMSLKRTYSRISNSYLAAEEGLVILMRTANDMISDIAFLMEIDELSMTDCNKMQNKLGDIVHISRVELIKIRRKNGESKTGNPTASV